MVAGDPEGLAYVVFDASQKAKARWGVSFRTVTNSPEFATMADAKAFALAALAPGLAERARRRAVLVAETDARAAAEEARSRQDAEAELAANPLKLRPGLTCELRFTERKKSLVEYCYRTASDWRKATILRQTWTGRWIVSVMSADGLHRVNRLSCTASWFTPDRIRARS